eukprot:1142628-Pelagomonas_calceolata.AAC.2
MAGAQIAAQTAAAAFAQQRSNVRHARCMRAVALAQQFSHIRHASCTKCDAHKWEFVSTQSDTRVSSPANGGCVVRSSGGTRGACTAALPRRAHPLHER